VKIREIKRAHLYYSVSSLVLFAFLLRGLASRFLIAQGDSASFVDFLTLRTSDRPLISDFTLSPWNLLSQNGIFSLSVSEFCNASFNNAFEGISNIHWHAYLLTPISGIASKIFFFIPPSIFALTLLALSYSFGIVSIYRFLLESHTSRLMLTVFTFTLFSSAVFIQSLLGQPYIDRISFGPFIAFILYRSRNKIASWAQQRNNLVVIGLISLISERAALMAGVLSFAFIFFHLKDYKLQKHDFIAAFFSFIPIGWFLFWKTYISASSYYSALNFNQALSNLQALFSSGRSHNFITLAVVLLPFLILILAGSRKLFLIAIIVVLPNLIVNIGGAELVGYYTHYHAMYLPIITAFTAISIVRIRQGDGSDPKQLVAIGLLILTIITSSMVGVMRTVDYPSSFSTNFQRNFGKSLTALGVYLPEDNLVRNKAYRDFIESLGQIDITKSVSAPEGLFPILLDAGFKKINYFPIGVGSSDILIFPVNPGPDQVPDLTLFGLMPKQLKEQAGGCFKNKIILDYNLNAERDIFATHYNIYVKKTSK